ncbi:MAG: hypothetical protein WD824_05080 [Cyclobacteriaceae bacterium]
MIKQEIRYIEFIHDVLISVHENLRELNEHKNFADPEELSHIEAKIDRLSGNALHARG